MYDLLIKNGTVVDGSGTTPRFESDVAIQDGVIRKVGANIDSSDARRVIDARGLIVAPGAIDLHTHFDVQVHWDPYCTPHSWHGVTSCLITNCGFGFAPVKPEMRERTMQMMETTEQVPVAAQREVLNWSWESFPEWIDHLRSLPKGMNLMAFLPINQLLIYVMGLDAAKKRRATGAEMAEMKALLNEAMDAGAAGFSFSYLLDTSNHTDADGSPMPSDIHDPEDYYELATVLRDRGEGVIQVTPNVPGTDSREVAEKCAIASGRPVLHLVCGPYDGVPGYHKEILAWLEDCAERGLQIFSQPASANAWLEFTLEYFNPWERVPYFRPFVNADTDEKLRMCTDPEFLKGAHEAYDPKILGGSGGTWETYTLIRAHCSKYEADDERLLGDIAESRGVHIVDLMFDILHESGMKAEFSSIPSGSDPVKYEEVLNHPRVLIGASDGGAHLRWLSTAWATEYIKWAVRKEQLMTLEGYHHKASGAAAEFMGLDNRGLVKEGHAADLQIYDFDALDFVRRMLVIEDIPNDFRRAIPPPTGMHFVILNGEVLLEDGKPVGPLPGAILSSGNASIAAGLPA